MVRRARGVDSERTAHPSPPEAPMLTVVRDTDTAEDVAARLREREMTVAEIAAAPVSYLSPAFLAAVQGLWPDLAEPAPRRNGLAAL
jgi:hypothetical protein